MTFRIVSLLILMSLVNNGYAADCPPTAITPWQRAGKPTCIHRFAAPSNTPHYSGGIVGGGAVIHGGDPCVHEGTWGWDYSGAVPLTKIWLGWSRKHYQAGGGKYHTDGPRIHP